MKKFFLLLCVCSLVLVSGCGGKPVSDPITVTVTEFPQPVETDVDFSRETTYALASSELADETGWGFAYSPANTLDLDYSTAWCSSSEDSEQILSLNFAGPVILGTVGIVPGFARDEEIFNQNNRLKTVEVYYDDLTSPVTTLAFEDEYKMQFFDLPEQETSAVSFKIKDIYAGSKYNDTCISEVDFWSDWVANKDAVAAYNYYQEYKQDFALRPVGVDTITMFVPANSATEIDACTEPSPEEASYGITYSHREVGDIYYFDAGVSSVFFRTKLNSYARAGDEITVKVVAKDCSEETVGYESKLLDSYDLVAESCTDGAVYIVGELDLEMSPEDAFFCKDVMQFYYGDRLIGVKQYGFIQ